MKVYFDVHGSLTVEGEDATEWLALRTWTARWSNNAGSLVVKWKTERMMQLGDEKPWPAIEMDSRKLFRCMTETPNVLGEGPPERRSRGGNPTSAACWRSLSTGGLAQQ
jgi:hypothetical protein